MLRLMPAAALTPYLSCIEMTLLDLCITRTDSLKKNSYISTPSLDN